MPRPPMNKEAARDLAARIAKGRQRLEKRDGTVALDRIAAEVYAATGVYVPRSTIYKLWHSQVDPHTVTLESILAVGCYLGLAPDDLGPVITGRLDKLNSLITGELVGAGDGNRTRVLSLGNRSAPLS